MDVCGFGFECMSRCCVDNKCSHFLNCIQKCKANSDCKGESTPCCSQGYCTDAIVCEGNKSIGDTCTQSQECISDYCDSNHLVCMAKPDIDNGKKESNFWIMAMILIFLAVILFFCLRKWIQKKLFSQDNDYILIGQECQNSGDKLS